MDTGWTEGSWDTIAVLSVVELSATTVVSSLVATCDLVNEPNRFSNKNKRVLNDFDSFVGNLAILNGRRFSQWEGFSSCLSYKVLALLASFKRNDCGQLGRSFELLCGYTLTKSAVVDSHFTVGLSKSAVGNQVWNVEQRKNERSDQLNALLIYHL